MEYFTVVKHASIPAQTFISLNRITKWGDYRKARIPKSPYTQKPHYRKARIPKSPYTQKPSINQVFGWTTHFWPRFGGHNPNLTLVYVLGYYKPIYDTILGPLPPIWTLFYGHTTRFWWICLYYTLLLNVTSGPLKVTSDKSHILLKVTIY
jgi:hypothetical protein